MNEDDGPLSSVASLNLQDLKITAALGRGAKGVVFLVQTQDGELLALKAISRASVEKKKLASGGGGGNGSEYRRIWFERQVLSSFQNLLLPKLRGVVSTQKIVGYAIDYCPGGDLNTLRKKQTENIFSGDIIRFYAAELVLVLEYLHGLGIVYRDLKPENVMIQENGHIMLIDFDLSTKLSPKSSETPPPPPKSEPPRAEKTRKKLPSWYMLCRSGISPEEDSVHPCLSSASSPSRSDSVEKSNSFVGTEEYVAPEVILGNGHDFSVDWWCLGVMLYEMLYGTTPFKGSNRKETFYRILSKEPDLVGEPTALRNLIGKLLEKDPDQRISGEEIKGHEFFRGVDWDGIVRMARPPFIPVTATGDTDGNKQIDVESFVQDAFKLSGDEEVGHKTDNNNNCNFLKIKEFCDPSHTQNHNFFIF
ncbi:PREDICTED: serine/threonine-protein kinase OXI1-like [Ipomoea nil]|uniref:serine/threonine-protein kinase OXI1-like n=1 Tax=Ipomoea nil TaxID=35883 RepID=UPI00090184D9|nr:PREDICTED: serine/threonine-protein kinase OXI1-like [Ipomoea nil]